MMKYLGDGRGIQGHQDSSYLDATMFGLFALSDVFDSMFLEGARDEGGKEISSILWKGIVNPLRKNGVVRYESVMKLRNKLAELCRMKWFDRDEEEFGAFPFKHIFKIEPFVHIMYPGHGVESMYDVPLLADYDKALKLPTVRDLMIRMFREDDAMLYKSPSKMFIQVPRSGRFSHHFQKIIPDLKLEVRDLVMSPYQCFNCEKPARKQCQECADEYKSEKRAADGLVHFCKSCSQIVHSPKSRSNHTVQDVPQPPDASELELLSVICIETSHYVCFVHWEKQWIFFDSMANCIYDMYYIPKVVDCTQDLTKWVYSSDHKKLLDTPTRELPEYVWKFTQDSYMWIYVTPDARM